MPPQVAWHSVPAVCICSPSLTSTLACPTLEGSLRHLHVWPLGAELFEGRFGVGMSLRTVDAKQQPNFRSLPWCFGFYPPYHARAYHARSYLRSCKQCPGASLRLVAALGHLGLLCEGFACHPTQFRVMSALASRLLSLLCCRLPGCGLSPYLDFVRRLTSLRREIFVIELPEVSQACVGSSLPPDSMAQARNTARRSS